MRPQILVVEPESALQAALSAWLEWEGYDCVCVSDREEALAIAEHDRPDVALVSDHGRGWSARGLASELKTLRDDLALVLLCGTGRCVPRPRRPLHVIDEIPAPVTRGAVTQAVARALQWREAPAADRRACLALEEATRQRADELRDACRAAAMRTVDDAGRVDAVGAIVGAGSFVAAALERRHPGAAAHARRVADTARLLGGALNLPARAMDALERAAFLHDLGKAALPDVLLQKPTPRSDLEIALLRRHPQIAFDILADVPSFEEAAAIVLATQERFDGRGYPRGLAALEIPMGARIVSLVDAFDRLMALGPRPSLAEACAELVRGAGSQFDPDLVRIWLRLAEAWHAPAADAARDDTSRTPRRRRPTEAWTASDADATTPAA